MAKQKFMLVYGCAPHLESDHIEGDVAEFGADKRSAKL